MLHVIKAFDNAIVIYTEEEGATQAIGKSTYALQPALGLFLFKHLLEIVCGTFCNQTIQIHLATELTFWVQRYKF
jgi:hypothetical protein